MSSSSVHCKEILGEFPSPCSLDTCENLFQERANIHLLYNYHFVSHCPSIYCLFSFTGLHAPAFITRSSRPLGNFSLHCSLENDSI